MRSVLQIAWTSVVSVYESISLLLKVLLEAAVEVLWQKNCRVECTLQPKAAPKLITVD